jgi:DNA modification methylase
VNPDRNADPFAAGTSPTTAVLTGDCLHALTTLPASSIDCMYLDPPFNTGRSQHDVAGTYHDRWPTVAEYMQFLRDRLTAAQRVLTDDATILVHVDWRTSHHVRILLEELFGVDAFVNHLIWHYGLGGSSSRRFARKHDDILFFANSPSYYFNPPQVPARSHRLRGKMKKATDVLDIASINNMARERVGYPTQKPLALLTLLIEACCPPGGMVLDPFCGSGTTLVAARELGRRAIGIDENPAAVLLAEQRLRGLDSCDARVTQAG